MFVNIVRFFEMRLNKILSFVFLGAFLANLWNRWNHSFSCCLYDPSPKIIFALAFAWLWNCAIIQYIHLCAPAKLTLEPSCPTFRWQIIVELLFHAVAHVQFWGVLFSHLCSSRSFDKMTLSPVNDWNEVKFHMSSWESLGNSEKIARLHKKAPLAPALRLPLTVAVLGTRLIFSMIIIIKNGVGAIPEST